MSLEGQTFRQLQLTGLSHGEASLLMATAPGGWLVQVRNRLQARPHTMMMSSGCACVCHAGVVSVRAARGGASAAWGRTRTLAMVRGRAVAGQSLAVCVLVCR